MSGNPSLEKAISSRLSPILRGDGFSGRGRHFQRQIGGLIQVVGVQGSRSGGKFAINLAAQPAGLPDVLGNPPSPHKITPELCEFRRRLSESGSDQWWAHDLSQEGMNAAMSEATQVYKSVGRRQLDEIAKPSSSLLTVTPDDFDAGRFDFQGFASTKVRMARALALMRLATGEHERARAFANIALGSLGGASGLRRELQEIAASA